MTSSVGSSPDSLVIDEARPVVSRMQGLVGRLKLRSLGEATSEDRGRERFRRALLFILAAVLGKGIAMISILVSVPLTLHLLGEERYGLWMTISSLLILLSFTDLGLGIGLMNSIAHASGKDEEDAVKCYVSVAFFMLLGIACLVLLVLSAAYPFVPWANLLEVTSPRARAEAGPAIYIFITCIAMGLPLSVVQRVQLGYQKGSVSNLWTSLGSIFGLVGLLVAVRLRAGLPTIVLVTTGLPLLAHLGNSLVYFGLQRPDLRPRWSRIQPNEAKRLIRLGGEFFILNLCFLASYSIDNILVAKTLGIESVASYSVCVKYFGLGLAVIHLAIASLWAAYGEAFARGDWAWLQSTFWRSILASLSVAGLFTLTLLVVSSKALPLWVGTEYSPSLSLLCGVGAWGVIDMVRVASSTFLNAINVVRFQIVLFFVFTLGGIGAKVIGARFYGLEGVAWGGVLALVLFMALPMLAYAHMKLSSR